jgi:hypothetical protein
LPVVTQRDLDRTIACQDQRSSIVAGQYATHIVCAGRRLPDENPVTSPPLATPSSAAVTSAGHYEYQYGYDRHARCFRIPDGRANKKSYAAVIAGTAAAQSPSIAAGSIGSRSRSKQPS